MNTELLPTAPSKMLQGNQHQFLKLTDPEVVVLSLCASLKKPILDHGFEAAATPGYGQSLAGL